MNWLYAVGFVALAALFLSVTVLVLMTRKGKFEPLPDGDYIVTIIEVRESPRGVETVFRIDEPVGFKGRTVTMVKGKTDGEGKG